MPHISLWDVLKFWWHAWSAVGLSLIEDLGKAGIALAFFSFLVRYAQIPMGKENALGSVREFEAIL